MSLRTSDGQLVVAKVTDQQSSMSVHLEANQLESLVLLMGAQPGKKLTLEWVSMTDDAYEATCRTSD